MPPLEQRGFSELPVQGDDSPSHSIAINDDTFGKEEEHFTKEQLEEKMRALKWLIAAGNGATPEAIQKFQARLNELEIQVKKMEVLKS